jgi:thiamine-phosphate pyrophosphorylase
MRPSQTIPQQWLIVATQADSIAAARRLPMHSGILLLAPLPASQMRQLRHLARARGLLVVREEPRTAARVHDLRELKRAMLRRNPIIMLSPLFPTQSHPDWESLPRMRAAALARLGRRKLLALGGMDARKFARIRALGFQGWAGISAFRT